MVNHLVLLMGENPLPNYVVAKYLLSESYQPEDRQPPKPDKIWVFHSKETETQAQSLCELIQPSQSDIERILVEDPRKISKTCRALMESIRPEPGHSLHINYTGGTKVMSVASALYGYLQISSLNKNNIYLSYIDSDRHEINYRSLDQNLDRDDFVLPGGGKDLRHFVEAGLQTLCDLHGLKRDHEICLHSGIEKPEESYSTRLIPRVVSEPNVFKEWSTFHKGFLYKTHSVTKVRGGGISRVEKQAKMLRTIDPIPLSFGDSDLTSIYQDYLQSRRCLTNNNRLTFCEQRDDFHCVNTFEFLHGRWLEYTVDLSLTLPNGVTGYRDVVLSSGTKRMQIDLLLIRGYQPFLISCTTAHKEQDVKSKCFEVHYRAQQIGGAEAKAIMVSLLHEQIFSGTKGLSQQGCTNMVSDLRGLQVDVSMDPQERPDLLMIGLDDFKDTKFAKKIATFVEEA